MLAVGGEQFHQAVHDDVEEVRRFAFAHQDDMRGKALEERRLGQRGEMRRVHVAEQG